MTATSDAATVDPYRLPRDVSPTRYDVALRPSLDDASFTGSVSITLDVTEETDSIVLNAIELEIATVTIDGVVATWSLDAETERLQVSTGERVAVGTSALHIEFTGVLNDKLRGFYRSTYVDGNGDEQVIATTQMQATDCRRAFPCFDEPDFKAIFSITLDVEDGLTAISNGEEIERTTGDGRTVIRFADTMVMSSYLVAFVVGHLESSEVIDVDGTPLRVVHIPGKGHLTQFGLDVGSFCLRWFQEYYGIEYPSDKVDLVALPDFAAGAMENLGCITFRESLLLVDPDNSTQSERQVVADVVAHELAHMWFGDLVTMRWWNGIWLNEAFATFMEILACDAFAPEWDRWTSFGQERSVAFDVDALSSTRSVEFEVHSPEEAEGMFDVLTYQKGGALLRMLEQYLGAEAFRTGVGHYLRTHSHSNTETNDLWDAIEHTSEQPVRRIMDSWIWQPGFPLVSAELVEGAVELRQTRFAYADDVDSTAVWAIPIHVRNGGETSMTLLDGPDPIQVPLADPSAAVVVNAGGHGFFRVAYGDALRDRLADPTTLAELGPLERYGLVDDAWSATVAGRLDSVGMIELLSGFGDEREYGVWQAIVGALVGLSRVVDGDALDALRSRVRDLVGPALADLGEPVDGEADLTGKLRGLLTRTMGRLGDDESTQDACRRHLAAVAAGERVDAELLAAATSVVAGSGGVEEYESMLAEFRDGATPQQQLRNLYALAEFDDADLMARTCELALSGDVKTQNAPFLLRSCIANRNHGPSAWEFVKANWEIANDRFPTNTISRMVDTVSQLNDVDDVQAFFTAHPIEQAKQTLQQILERQRVNADLRARDGAQLASHLLG